MKQKYLVERVMNAIFFVCGLTAIACVVLISVYMIIAGVPAIGKIGFIDFLFGTKWASTAAEPSYGILPFILTSIYGTVGAILIGVPVGLLTAVFLSKIAPRGLAAPVSTAVELLAGIPSVVYGLLGMTLLVPAVAKTFGIASGACLFSAILVLALMILPNIVSVSVTALNAVPPEYEEASLALGATETETYFKVSIPAAKSGIAAGVVLGIGRAIGEAMAVIMVAGQRSQHAGPVPERHLPDYCHRQGNVLCGWSAAPSAVFHCAGAVRVHHGDQRAAQFLPEGRKKG